MKVKRILIAILKAIRDIIIMFGVIIIFGMIGALIRLYLEVSIYYYFCGLFLLVSIIIISISYYKKENTNKKK